MSQLQTVNQLQNRLTFMMGVWSDAGFHTERIAKVEWRYRVIAEVDRPHEHEIVEDHLHSGVISWPDGCQVELRVAFWDELDTHVAY